VEALAYFVATLLLNSFLPFWLPWYMIVPVNLFLTLPFRLSKAKAFWLGGFSAGIPWLVYSLWLSNENEHILAPRLTQLLMLPHPILLFALLFLLPFLLGAISGMTGVMIKFFFKTNV
jgi:hypothetical protein